MAYDYLVLGLGAEVNYFGVEGAAEHAFPLSRSPMPCGSRTRCCACGKTPRNRDLIEDGALNIVVVGGGPTGVETGARSRALQRGLPQGLPRRRGGRLADRAGRGVAGDFLHVRARASNLHGRGADQAWRRGPDRRGSRVGLDGASEAEVGQGVEGAHARVGRRPEGTLSSSRSASSSSEGIGSQSTATFGSRLTRKYSRSATSQRSQTRRPSRCCPSWARSRSSRASTSERRSPSSWQARRRSPSSTRTRARWRRSAGAGGRADARREDDEGQEGPARLEDRPPRAASDEQGPCEGRGRLGRRRVHSPALGTDQRRDVTDAADQLFERLGAVKKTCRC